MTKTHIQHHRGGKHNEVGFGKVEDIATIQVDNELLELILKNQQPVYRKSAKKGRQIEEHGVRSVESAG